MSKVSEVVRRPRAGRPHVMVNFAMTLDGKISTRAGTPSTFTSAYDKKRLLEIRSLGDALLVGRRTVSADHMSMGLPSPALRRAREARGQSPFPLRVVVSPSGRFDPRWKIFHSPGGKVLLFGSSAISDQQKKRLAGLENTDLYLPEKFTLRGVLRTLRQKYGVQTLVCEGGPTLLRGLLELGAVDELFLTIAPRMFGGENAPTLTGPPGEFLPSTQKFTLRAWQAKAGEIYLHYLRT